MKSENVFEVCCILDFWAKYIFIYWAKYIVIYAALPRSGIATLSSWFAGRSPGDPAGATAEREGYEWAGPDIPSSSPPTQHECSVQFMWQPTINITYPCVTLLASFQVRGSVSATS